MKLRSPFLIAVILLAGLVLATGNSRQTAENSFAVLERSASPQWNVDLSVKPDTVRVGDSSITVTIKSSRNGYLTLLQCGTDGKEDVVFPNALDQDNYVEVGKPLILPRTNWQWKATPPAGEGSLLAIVSEKPIAPRAVQAGLRGQAYGSAVAVYREWD